jgi:uncharacterized membrane protein YbaN (DUF454 family)
MKKIIRNTIGIILIIFGCIGGFIPVLQGWIFVLAGYILLDFKKKNDYEEKILILISKTKIGRKLAILWKNIKNKNKKAIESDTDKRLHSVFHDIDKNTAEKNNLKIHQKGEL